MIFLIVADNQSSRRTHIDTVIASFPQSEVLVFDDTNGTIADLEQYIYPSLFSAAPPILHLKFMLASEDATALLLKKLLASPTVFLFEEMAVAATTAALFKKSGATIRTGAKRTSVKKDGDIFAVTSALTAPDKKGRWMAYQAALRNHSIEAIMGILYWKIRDLANKNPNTRTHYNDLYHRLLSAHARAWEIGAPLELLVEKVILDQ